MRRRIIRKNKKRRDPRYFLHEADEEAGEESYRIPGSEEDPARPGAHNIEPEESDSGLNVEFLERQDWLQAKGMRADPTTDEDHEALRNALAGKNIVDPMDVNQIMKATQNGSENDVIPLGKVGEEVWFKTGDNKYGKLTLTQSEKFGLGTDVSPHTDMEHSYKTSFWGDE